MYKVVKYNNWMNELDFNAFTPMDSNFLFAICAKAKEQGDSTLLFSFDELRAATQYEFHGLQRFVNDLRRMNRKMLAITTDLELEPGEYASFNLFSTFRTSMKNQTLTISVNPDFGFVLNGLVENYTKFELECFVALRSKYSKTLFRALKQWRTTGRKTYSVEDLHELLSVPQKKSYTTPIIWKQIIEPAVQDLKDTHCFHDFRCTINRLKRRGRPVSSYTFSWRPEIVEEAPPAPASEEGKEEKKGAPARRSNRFNDFEQNDYDYDQLEMDLLDSSVDN